MSPDWSAKVEPVPYAKLGAPQSLNLYAYVQGNPESASDLDGHELVTFHASNIVQAQQIASSMGLMAGTVTQVTDDGGSGPSGGAAQQQNDNTEIAQNNPPSPPKGRTNSPAQGQKPNSTTTITQPDGSTTTRTYGPDGKAVKDVDTHPDHGAGSPHAHDWDWNKTPPRQPGRPLTPEEKQQITKAAAAGAAAAGTGVIIWHIMEGIAVGAAF